MGDLPTRIGSYRVLSKLGEGGMGTVYEAVADAPGAAESGAPAAEQGAGQGAEPGPGPTPADARHVAIKILHAEYARSEEFSARFFNEARAISSVSHKGLVQVLDQGALPDGPAYIVMELLVGEALSVRLKRSGGAIPVEDALRLGALIADSLSAAHERGIVHRDLKPEQVRDAGLDADAASPAAAERHQKGLWRGRRRGRSQGVARARRAGPEPGSVRCAGLRFSSSPAR